MFPILGPAIGTARDDAAGATGLHHLPCRDGATLDRPDHPRSRHDMHRSTSSPAALRRSITEAVEAASSRDADRFTLAADRLAVQDPHRLTLVQAWVLRSLLEQSYPDGLSSEDAHEVLRRCLLSAAAWYPQVDPGTLVPVLTGALGVSDPEPDPGEAHTAAGPAALSLGAALLIADLLSVAGDPLAGYLDGALAELERAETIELP
jgi:hypothetical protein